ncbi:MAG: NUDIX domain-containing protein [Caldilineaceae bacterium]
MQILGIGHNIAWLPLPNEIALILDHQLPPLAAITSALALAFDGDHILMTNLRQRGWDIPGGHLESGETPETAMRREVMEEAGALLTDVQLLGYQRIRLLGEIPPGYRYPHPDSYQVLYLARVAALVDFAGNHEASQRALFAPTAAQELKWVQENRLMYDQALAQVKQLGWVNTAIKTSLS